MTSPYLFIGKGSKLLGEWQPRCKCDVPKVCWQSDITYTWREVAGDGGVSTLMLGVTYLSPQCDR